MITRDKTQRAIEAIKQENTRHFHGNLAEYLIEVLEAQELPPSDYELKSLHKQVLWISRCIPLDEQETYINELFEDEEEPVNLPDNEQTLYQPDNSIKEWQLSILSIIAFFSLLAVLYKVG